MKTVAVVDFSWEMHKERESLKMLTIKRVMPNGTVMELPTGHVYGTWNDIQALAGEYSLVILAVDSPCHKRKALLSQYKSDRHTPTGDPLVDYNIYNDLVPLLKLCTSLPNVFYVKEDEMEADDIIASFIRASNTDTNKRYSVYMRDKDILQNSGRYVWYDKMSGAPVDRLRYIDHAIGFDRFEGDRLNKFDYFPLPVKVLTGDTSDCIPNAVPRFPKDKLYELCTLVSRDNYEFDPIIQAFKQVRDSMNDTWKSKLQGLDDPNSDLYKALRLNYDMVCPIHKDTREFKYKQLGADSTEVMQILDSYQIKY